VPIKGLTDGAPTFPKLGDIRKGAKKTRPDRPGQDLDHFRAVFPEEEAEAAARFFEEYGDEPKELNIILPFHEIDRVFETWQEEYTAGALIHRCDGETTTLWRDEGGTLHHEPKACPGGCVPVGRLKVIIPELRRLAYVVVHTTSKWDLDELSRNLRALQQLTGGQIAGIPLVLKRRPRNVSTPGKDGKRVRRVKSLLAIEADAAWVDAKIGEMRRLALPTQHPQIVVGSSSDAAIEADFPADEIEAQLIALEEADALGELDGFDEDGTEEAREMFPAEWDKFVAVVVKELHYAGTTEVADELRRAGYSHIVGRDGRIVFDAGEAWIWLKEHAPEIAQERLM
jgi:hypothetical protein